VDREAEALLDVLAVQDPRLACDGEAALNV
jgi:hypothetical protein